MRTPAYRVQLVKDGSVTYSAESITNADVAAKIAKEYIGESDRENVVVLFLNKKNKVAGVNLVSVGTLSESLVHPREVFKAAILANSATIILVHNHPSGDPEPSASDVEITKKMHLAGEILGIRLLDHIIIGDDKHYSFQQYGLIPCQ